MTLHQARNERSFHQKGAPRTPDKPDAVQRPPQEAIDAKRASRKKRALKRQEKRARKLAAKASSVAQTTSTQQTARTWSELSDKRAAEREAAGTSST